MFGRHHCVWQSVQCGCPDPPKSSKPLLQDDRDWGSCIHFYTKYVKRFFNCVINLDNGQFEEHKAYFYGKLRMMTTKIKM